MFTSVTKRLAAASGMAVAAAAPALVHAAPATILLQTGLGALGCFASGVLIGLGLATGQPEAVAYGIFGAYANC